MVTRLLKEQEGQTLIEYSMLVVLIAIACVFVVYTLGKRLELVYDNIQQVIALNFGGPSEATRVNPCEIIPPALSNNEAIAVFGGTPDLQAP
jgi:Flp pilus assembly pilin Flp